MNKCPGFYQNATALFFSVLLSLTVCSQAEELVGTVISGSTSQTSSVSSAATQLNKTADMQQKIESNFERLAQNPSHPAEFSHSDFHLDKQIIIPIVGILVIFGGGFFFVVSLVVVRNRAAALRRTQRQEQIQRFIDAGRDVPNELLHDVDSMMNDETNLVKGVRDTLVGSAILVFLTVLVGFEIGSLGLIIIAAGLSRLIVWKIAQSKKSSH